MDDRFIYRRNIMACTSAPEVIEFSTEGTATIRLTKNSNVNIEYSTDGDTWQSYASDTQISIDSSNSVYFRGVNNKYMSTSLSSVSQFKSTGSDVRCRGNIMSLLNYKKTSYTIYNNYCFCRLFKDMKNLIEAPELPARKLTESCYKRLFKGCTALREITMMATSISAANCLQDWVSGVTSGGTFYKNSSAAWTGNIPTGWTVVTV